MQPSYSEATYLTIIISTLLLLLFGGLLVYYFFIQQRRRYEYLQEVAQLRETYTQSLLQSKLEIQEQTLDHIAKELHANFSHLVSLININLSAIMAESHGKVRENIQETKVLTKQLMGDLKTLSATLNTDYLMKTGFANALRHEANRLSKTGRYTVTFTKTGTEFRLKADRETILFRLCQEIINNIVRHAEAKNIIVSIAYSQNVIIIEIEDDGKGFELEKIHNVSNGILSTGFINMETRARLINAKLNVASLPSKGTKVSVSIPGT